MNYGIVRCDGLQRYQEAIDQFGKAIAIRPDLALAHSNLALALIQDGQGAKALAAYRKACELDPGLRNPMREAAYLAEAAQERGDASAVRAHYQAVVEHARAALAASKTGPRRGEALLMLGTAQTTLGAHEAAVASWRQLLAERPPAAVALRTHWTLGVLLCDTLRRFKEALRLLRRAVELRPEDPWAHATLALGLLMAQDHEAALASYRTALRLFGTKIPDPRMRPIRTNAANAAARVGGKAHDDALVWLRSELAAWRGILASGDAASVIPILRHWKSDPDYASVRDAKDLSEDWQELWADVDALIQRAQEAGGK